MKNRSIFFPVVLVFASFGFGATHVFWYKALERGYNLQDNPGPNIPAGAIVHERMIMSAGVAQHSGNASDGWFCGNGLDDAQGRCGVVWSRDLCEMQGSCTSAKFRGEFRDGFSGNGFCNAGPIAIRCGIEDFQGNLDIWGGPDLVAETATWGDLYTSLCGSCCPGSTMCYACPLPDTMGVEEIISYSAPSGRLGESEPSVLDKQFAEIDITDQVNWILAHPGQWAIAFCVTPGMGSTGKINLYANEAASGTQTGSDNPWTRDGNTAHFVVEGDLSPVSIEKGQQVSSILSLVRPNPFTSSASIPYNLSPGRTGSMRIFDIRGKMVFKKAMQGTGTVLWDAAGLPSGVYILKALSRGRQYSEKLVLQR